MFIREESFIIINMVLGSLGKDTFSFFEPTNDYRVFLVNKQ